MSSEGILSTGMTTSHGIGLQVCLDVNGQLTSSYQVNPAKSTPELPIASAERSTGPKDSNPLEVESQATETPVLLTSEGFSPLFDGCSTCDVRGKDGSKGILLV